jgi:hypothetical protein
MQFQELPLVALQLQEKIDFHTAEFSFPSGLNPKLRLDSFD